MNQFKPTGARKIIKTLFQRNDTPVAPVTAEGIPENYNQLITVPPSRKRLINPAITAALIGKK
jgi:hypothetical protein